MRKIFMLAMLGIIAVSGTACGYVSQWEEETRFREKCHAYGGAYFERECIINGHVVFTQDNFESVKNAEVPWDD